MVNLAITTQRRAEIGVLTILSVAIYLFYNNWYALNNKANYSKLQAHTSCKMKTKILHDGSMLLFESVL